jgi:hypothetical protein
VATNQIEWVRYFLKDKFLERYEAALAQRLVDEGY